MMKNLVRIKASAANGDGNTTQGGVNLAGVAGLSSAAVTESFDEPLSKEAVLAIAGLFIRK